MRLRFSVLWFDDNEDYFDSLDLEPLQQEIRSWGFIPVIDLVSTPEDFTSQSPFEKYDLIVVDQNLEGYQDGKDFIANIRNNAIYTEVVFYTAGNAADLWSAIKERELEGVFVSSRSEILSKLARVGRQSIRKVLDLENMRGIVMAEVGELDLMLGEIIAIGIEGLVEEKRQSIFTRFYESAAKQNKDDARRLNDFIENPGVTEMLELSDSNKRWQNFNRLSKAHDQLRGQPRVGDYVEEVLKPRNFLAHGRPVASQNGGYTFDYRGNEYHFNDTTSLQLRRTILEYKSALDRILGAISGQ
jgi:hypothetical protein